MSVIETAVPPAPRLGGAWPRLVVVVLAVAVVAAGLAVLGWLLSASLASPPATKNPFAAGLREAVPAASGIGGFILVFQMQFYQALTGALQAMKADGAVVTSLAGIGFLYGVFHAAGPGHGKGVIAAYIVSSGRSLRRGLSLSLAAALLQAIVAVALVGALAVLLNATAASINATARWVEIASFAAVAALGAVLVWRKAGRLVAIAGVGRGDPAEDHAFIAPGIIQRPKDWRDMAGVVAAAGIRPCSGAIILLVFALSQHLFLAGVVGAFAMALGTAITTGSLAALAVFAKSLALRLAATRGSNGALAVAGLEVIAAAFVLVLGAILLTGLWAGGLPNALD